MGEYVTDYCRYYRQDTDANVALANRMFKAARHVYDEYQHSHNPPTDPGVLDYTFEWASCAFFVLDMRGNRDYNRENNRVLGTDQLQRFKNWLHSSVVQNATVIYVVSPVPILHARSFIINHLDLPLLSISNDMRDEWEHKSNWAERNEILDESFELSHRTGKPVIFLSGDVHVAAAFRLFRPSASDVSGKDPKISWHVYGNTGKPNEVMRLKAVELD